MEQVPALQTEENAPSWREQGAGWLQAIGQMLERAAKRIGVAAALAAFRARAGEALRGLDRTAALVDHRHRQPAALAQLAGKLAECCHLLRVFGGDPQGYLHH